MLNLNLKTPKEFLENKDEIQHNTPCVYLLLSESHSIESFELFQGDIEFIWVEYDQNNEHTGNMTRFTEENEGWMIGDRLDNEETYDVLEWRIDGLDPKESRIFINTLESFEKALDEA